MTVTFQPWTDAIELTKALRKKVSAKQAIRIMRTDPYWLLMLFRARKIALRYRIPFLNRILRMCQIVFGGIELGNEVTLGSGVYFIHSLGTVIGGDAKVGNRVRFMGCNTVGTARDNGYPVIEDDVEVGCGARVLGPVRIGARAIIGANAVVLADVPADAVAVGVPARIISRGGRRTDLQLVAGTEVAR